MKDDPLYTKGTVQKCRHLRYVASMMTSIVNRVDAKTEEILARVKHCTGQHLRDTYTEIIIIN